MYEGFYGLKERPFELTSNPRFLFLTSRHREALSNLQYGIGTHKSLTLLLGEAGTGKTTLVRAVLALYQSQGQHTRAVHLSNPTLTRKEFVELLSAGFGLGPDATLSKAQFLLELTRTASERRAHGGITALLVDEAQSLPHELLEEIRLLTNIENRTDKLVPVVLIGQPELAERLNESSLRQLKQRVALRCTLEPLDLRETAAYITKRIRISGGDSATMFTRDAVELIFIRSRGIPRTINVICDNALVSGFALQRRPVGADIVEEVCRDFDLTVPPDRELPPSASAAAPLAPAPVSHDAAPADAGETPLRLAQPAEAAVGGATEMFATFRRRRRFSFF
jgi:general secretion pathway protein A